MTWHHLPSPDGQGRGIVVAGRAVTIRDIGRWAWAVGTAGQRERYWPTGQDPERRGYPHDDRAIDVLEAKDRDAYCRWRFERGSVTCEGCGGSGYYQTDPYVISCETCRGIGRVMRVPCSHCLGCEGIQCVACKGSDLTIVHLRPATRQEVRGVLVPCATCKGRDSIYCSGACRGRGYLGPTWGKDRLILAGELA